MSCFNHKGTESVGSCKNCGRHLCSECLAPELDSVACKGRCEEKVQAIDAYMNKAVHSKVPPNTVIHFVLPAMLGLLSFILRAVKPSPLGLGYKALALNSNSFASCLIQLTELAETSSSKQTVKILALGQ